MSADLGLFLFAGRVDLRVERDDLVMDEGLQTAVLISLYSDRRAIAEELDKKDVDPRGWWADEFAENSGDQIGSKLWLIDRSKRVPETLARAKQYAEEALAWMIEDGVAESVTSTPSWAEDGSIDHLIEIQREGRRQAYRFKDNWAAELGQEAV